MTVFITLALKQPFQKRIEKKLKGHFVVEQNTIKNVKTPYKSDQPEANVRQIACAMQKRRILKRGILPLTT